ncbi:chaperone protein dnaJ 20, chloroplastic [Cajanus cajan]|uniref:J domain-containing protein n=1 Tax=Cajanus cajan TaxID=3821 RepID=A0A151T2C3_CAJCA|nr:chaperone protein dnaJ 20, chloroplastic [Cajanus cajan]KYP61131.1 hypothetical protein KK1_023555 [Cajanus cajan]
MDVVSLSSSSSLSMSMPFQFHGHNKQRGSNVRFGTVSCRATRQESLYKILSVSPGSATMDEIKRAYRSMALRYHPDVCHDPSMKEESTRMFVQLNAAYETLSNPNLRAQYDHELGLRSKVVMNINVGSDDHERWGSGLHEEVIELKTRSRRRMGHKGGSGSCSWGSTSRMRTQNMKGRHSFS